MHGLKWWYEGISIGRVRIPYAFETQHFLIAGASGVGKTNLIRNMIEEVQARDEIAIIFDPEGDNVKHFYNAGRGDLVLHPNHAYCPYWDPWMEFRPATRDADIVAFTESLIRGKPGDSKQDFFLEGSRTVVQELFKRTNSIDQLMHFLSLDPKAIQRSMRGTLAAPLIQPGATAQNAGILGGMANRFKPFMHLPRRADTKLDWNARDWTENPSGWLFMSSRKDLRTAAFALQGLWLDAIVRWLLSRDEDIKKRIWVFIDEFALIGSQPQIYDALIGGRKRNLSIVLGFQHPAQVRMLYGSDIADTILDGPRTKVFFAGGREMNEWSSKQIDQREILKIDQTRSQSGVRRSTSESEHLRSTHLVMPAQFEKLRLGRAYLAVRGFDRIKVRIPKNRLQPVADAFILRQPQQLPPQPPSAQASVKLAPAPEPTSIPTAAIWSNLEARCRSAEETAARGLTQHRQWAHYGGRRKCVPCGELYPGDRACPKCKATAFEPAPVRNHFKNMEEIKAVIGPRLNKTDTIDRIDPLGDYGVEGVPPIPTADSVQTRSSLKHNIRWLPKEKQNANRRFCKKQLELKKAS